MQCGNAKASRSADLVPQRSDSLHCRDLLERDGEGVPSVPVWVGPYQAADLHQHLINCTAGKRVKSSPGKTNSKNTLKSVTGKAELVLLAAQACEILLLLLLLLLLQR